MKALLSSAELWGKSYKYCKSSEEWDLCQYGSSGEDLQKRADNIDLGWKLESI